MIPLHEKHFFLLAANEIFFLDHKRRKKNESRTIATLCSVVKPKREAICRRVQEATSSLGSKQNPVKSCSGKRFITGFLADHFHSFWLMSYVSSAGDPKLCM